MSDCPKTFKIVRLSDPNVVCNNNRSFCSKPLLCSGTLWGYRSWRGTLKHLCNSVDGTFFFRGSCFTLLHSDATHTAWHWPLSHGLVELGFVAWEQWSDGRVSPPFLPQKTARLCCPLPQGTEHYVDRIAILKARTEWTQWWIYGGD